jgi:hypothetical protein
MTMTGHDDDRGMTATRVPLIPALGLAVGVLCGSGVAFFMSLGVCRRENVTPPAACPLVDDYPGMLLWTAVVAPVVVVLALAVIGCHRRAVRATAAATLTFWGGYMASVLLT